MIIDWISWSTAHSELLYKTDKIFLVASDMRARVGIGLFLKGYKGALGALFINNMAV